MDVKRCPRCDRTRPVTTFGKLTTTKDGYRPWCKDCTNAVRRERYASTGGVDESYAAVLRREYGITLDDYNRMVRAQGNRCAICRRPETATYPSGRVKRLSVDHDHATNQVRALLCQRCNTLVWALEDNHTTLASVEAYIREHQATFAAGPPL